jgi:hypothetical protein
VYGFLNKNNKELFPKISDNPWLMFLVAWLLFVKASASDDQIKN